MINNFFNDKSTISGETEKNTISTAVAEETLKGRKLTAKKEPGKERKLRFRKKVLSSSYPATQSFLKKHSAASFYLSKAIQAPLCPIWDSFEANLGPGPEIFLGA